MGDRVALTFVLCLIAACNRSGEDPLRTQEASLPGPTTAHAKAAGLAPRVAPAPSGTVVYADLLSLLHLADVYDPSGLFVDFGTAARLKYTNGNWNSGWLGDSTEDGKPVSTFGKKARVLLPIEERAPMVLRARVKAYAPGPLVFYLNGRTLGQAKLSPKDGFVEVDIPVSADAIKPGENSLLLRARKTRRVAGKPRSVAVDWIRLEPSVAGSEGATPEPIGVSVAEHEAGGVPRRAIRLVPGAQVDWFIEGPARGVLVFGAATKQGQSVLEVEAKSDYTNPNRIPRRIELRPEWTDDPISLNIVGGELARLRLRNAGEEDVLLSDVRVVRPATEVTDTGAQARNVIVLLIDTLRASKLQLYNPQSRVKTPVLNELAAEGVLFERPQSPENWTKPAVASVLTSLHPATHQTKEQSSRLPQSALTLGEAYKKAGFKTASFIANGYVSNAFGFDQGWDHYTNYIRERRSTTAEKVFGEAGAWIEKNKGNRFFVYIQTIDPHVPYDPPDEFLTMYDPAPYQGQVKNRRTHLMLDDAKKNPGKYKFTKRDKERLEALHDGEISYHDAYLGMFLEKLDALGLDENTILVVTSDHGEEFQEHGSWGHGHSVYQELLEVPLMIRWPQAVPAGLRIGSVVSTVDIGPTVLEATGVAVPREFEGRSLLGFVRGDWPSAPHVAFSDFLDHRRVIRGGDWKLIVRGDLSHVLFDLQRDPWETKELDGREHPIAQRYLRTVHGQFLGAEDRGRWLAPKEAVASISNKAKLSKENQEMTPELCRQLVALGYVTAECDALLKN